MSKFRVSDISAAIGVFFVMDVFDMDALNGVTIKIILKLMFGNV